MIVTLRTLDATGAEVTHPIEIEPIPCSMRNEWREVKPECARQNRYNDKRRGKHEQVSR